MAFWRVETYTVAFARETTEQIGAVRVRQQAPWEAEVADVSVVSPHASASPFDHFEALTAQLAEHGWRPLVCGACVHFRRPFDDAPDNWKGVCTWGEPEDPVYIPTPRALLAPACHRFMFRETPMEIVPADEPVAASASTRADTEATIAIQAPDAPHAPLWQRFWQWVKRLWQSPAPAEEPFSHVGPRCPTCGVHTVVDARLTCGGGQTAVVCTLFHCTHCETTFFDTWNEALVETAPQDAARLYVIPPSLANVAVRMWRSCATPYNHTCDCQAHRWFAHFGQFLYQEGRRIEPRTHVSTI